MEEKRDEKVHNLEELASLVSRMLEETRKAPQILQLKPTEVANIFFPAPWEKEKRGAAASMVSSVLKALHRMEARG